MNDYFKKSVLALHGYTSPPQREFRIKLNQNESPFDVPEHLKIELLAAARTLPWNRYPYNESPALMRRLARRHGVEPEQVLLGNGSNQLFQTLLAATLEPGDAVVYTPPTFSLYDLYTRIYDGRLVSVEQPPGADYPLAAILAAIQEHRPKLIYICSPNNPTGWEMDPGSLERICQAAVGLVFYDEAYGEFCDRSAIPSLGTFENLLISRTFSKAFSLAGLRFGYFVGDAAVIAQLRKVNIPYNINVFTELVALRLLDHEEEMARQVEFIKKERDRVFAVLQSMHGIVAFPSAANFILMHGPDGLDLFQALKNYGILVRDMSGYPLLSGYQRVSIGLEQENNIFLQTLEQIMNDYLERR